MVYRKILTIVGIISLSFLLIDETSAEQLNYLQSKIKHEEVQQQMSEMDEEVVKLMTEIKENEQEIEEITTIYANNKRELDSVQEDIDHVEERIEILEENIQTRKDILDERVTSYQRSGGDIRYLEVLFGSKSFLNFISRVGVFNTIVEADTAIMGEQVEDYDKLEVELANLNELGQELRSIKEHIEEQKKLSEEKQEKLDNKKEELEEKIKHLQIKESELLGFILAEEEYREEYQLGWPTIGGYISSPMGYRWGRMHKGIDIARTDRSTSPPILAAKEGVIESVGTAGGYGNRIIIDHGEGMKTLYAHLSQIDVEVGQEVERYEQIGIMGTTGNSTGIHLHLEVIINGSHQNPMQYLEEERTEIIEGLIQDLRSKKENEKN